jgi:hypothetical protein
MVMKWFTREWHSGGLSDDGVEARRAGYWSHEDAVRSRLPEALQLFAGQPDEIGRADLHDGRVEWWALDGARSFTLQVICGWVQIGYRRLVIQYRGHVELFGASESDVAGWLDDASTELLYDEVDIAADDRLEHRFLRLPRGEFGVRLRMRWWSPRRHRGGRTPGVAPQAIGVARDVRANAPRLGFRSLACAHAVVRPSRGGQSEQLVAGTRELGISSARARPAHTPRCASSARARGRRREQSPSHEGYPKGGLRPNVMDVPSISVVVLDPEIAPRDQATWAFTDGDDAMAMAGFLNTRVGGGKEIAWVEVVPLARKLNKKAMRYLDCWASLVEEARQDDQPGQQ